MSSLPQFFLKGLLDQTWHLLSYNRESSLLFNLVCLRVDQIQSELIIYNDYGNILMFIFNYNVHVSFLQIMFPSWEIFFLLFKIIPPYYILGHLHKEVWNKLDWVGNMCTNKKSKFFLIGSWLFKRRSQHSCGIGQTMLYKHLGSELCALWGFQISNLFIPHS